MRNQDSSEVGPLDDICPERGEHKNQFWIVRIIEVIPKFQMDVESLTSGLKAAERLRR